MLIQLLARLRPIYDYCKSNFITLYWGGVLGLLPFFIRIHKTAANHRLCKELFLNSAIILGLILFGLEKPKKYLLLCLSYLVIMGYFNQFNQYDGNVILMTLKIGLMSLLLIKFTQIKWNMVLLLNILRLSALLQAGWLIANYLGYDPGDWISSAIYGDTVKKFIRNDFGEFVPATTQMVIGALGNPNLSGAWIAIVIPAFLRKKWLICLPIIIVGIYLSKSTMPWVTALGASLVYFYIRGHIRHKYVVLAAIGGVTNGVNIWGFKLSEWPIFNTSGRLPIWKKALIWRTDLSDIVFGNGPGFFESLFSKLHKTHAVLQNSAGEMIQQPQWWRYAHNDYIDLYVMYGVVGIMIFIFFLSKIKAKKNPIFCSIFIGYCINAFGNFPTFISSICVLGIISYAIIISNNMEVINEESNRNCISDFCLKRIRGNFSN